MRHLFFPVNMRPELRLTLAISNIYRIHDKNAFALSEAHSYATHERTSPHWLDNLPWRGEFWHHGLMPFPR
jgi:hypothetical protein